MLLRWDTYVYYGDQPLVVLNFPLWWAPVNSLIDVAVAVAIVRYQDSLRGIRQLLIIPLAMAISEAVNTLAGWPSWTAINSDLGWVARDVLGVCTFVIAAVLLRLIGRAAVAVPSVDSIDEDPVLAR